MTLKPPQTPEKYHKKVHKKKTLSRSSSGLGVSPSKGVGTVNKVGPAIPVPEEPEFRRGWWEVG